MARNLSQLQPNKENSDILLLLMIGEVLRILNPVKQFIRIVLLQSIPCVVHPSEQLEDLQTLHTQSSLPSPLVFPLHLQAHQPTTQAASELRTVIPVQHADQTL